MKRLSPGRNNIEERRNFVKYWAEYVRTHPDAQWSRQQNILINGQIKNTRVVKAATEKYVRASSNLMHRKP